MSTCCDWNNNPWRCAIGATRAHLHITNSLTGESQLHDPTVSHDNAYFRTVKTERTYNSDQITHSTTCLPQLKKKRYFRCFLNHSKFRILSEKRRHCRNLSKFRIIFFTKPFPTLLYNQIVSHVLSFLARSYLPFLNVFFPTIWMVSISTTSQLLIYGWGQRTKCQRKTTTNVFFPLKLFF